MATFEAVLDHTVAWLAARQTVEASDAEKEGPLAGPGRAERAQQWLSKCEQKNFGISQTDADVIVFVGSDVVPDQSWLTQLLAALERGDVDVVGGETYLTTDSFYERLCAAFWNFDVQRNG